MKKLAHGEMSIDFNEEYDAEDDIYYVTFKTGEPSHSVEIDDVLLLEVGMFSGMPTGFRIFNYSKNKVKQISFPKIRKIIETSNNKIPSLLKERSATMESAFAKVLCA